MTTKRHTHCLQVTKKHWKKRSLIKEEASTSTSTISSNLSNLQRATRMVQWTANIVWYHLSSKAGNTLSLQSHQQQSTSPGHLIIDSGTNVSVMGRTWAGGGQHRQDVAKWVESPMILLNLTYLCAAARLSLKWANRRCSSACMKLHTSNTTLMDSYQQDMLARTVRGLMMTHYRCHGGEQCIAGQDD